MRIEPPVSVPRVAAASRAAESEWLNQPDDSLFDRLEQFELEAQQAKLNPTQYALRWLLDQPGIASVVVGVKRIDQLNDVLDAS